MHYKENKKIGMLEKWGHFVIVKYGLWKITMNIWGYSIKRHLLMKEFFSAKIKNEII